jgi:hypothetical protein
VLIPLLPSSSIDEVVAQVRAARKPEVELLVPNNMKALQSSAGCTILKHIVADSGAHLTLFTNDDRTQQAAQRAGLNVIAVDGTIVGPTQPLGPSNQHHAALPPDLKQLYGGGPSKAASRLADAQPAPSATAPTPQPSPRAESTAAISAPPVVSDDEFLAGLQAFEQTLVPVPHTNVQEWNTDEGALLFDGERGIGRQDARPQDAWALAFDDIGVAMAEEPEPATPRQQPVAEAIPPRRPSTTRAARPAASSNGRAQQPATQGAERSRFGNALTSVFPRSSRTGGNGSGTPPPRTAPKGAAPPQRFNPWIMVMIAAAVLIAALLFSLGRLPIGTTTPTLALSPAAAQAEQQSYGDLVIPISDAAPQEAAAQVQAVVLAQPVSVLVQGQAISTTVAPIGRASGVLVLRNTLSQPVLLRAGTVVPASNGVQFSVDADVTVPAALATADGITFGREVASLTANVPGAAGNIGPGSIGSIPGYEGTLRVEQGEFSGGSDQEVLVVRSEDVNRVLPDALSRLYGTGSQSLQLAAAGRTGFALVPDTVSPTLESLQQLQGVEYGVFPPVGSVTSDGTFRLEMRATFNAVAEPTDRPISSQVTAAARNLLISDGRAAPDAQVQVSQWTIGPQGLLVAAAVQPAGTAPTLAPALAEEVQRTIAGKPRAEALEYLRSLVEEGGSPHSRHCLKTGKRYRSVSRSCRHRSEPLARGRTVSSLVFRTHLHAWSYRSTRHRSEAHRSCHM